MNQVRLLAAFAHPDDEAFPVGGALAMYASRGVDVHLICATSGEEGEIRDPSLATRENLPQVRREELRCSCRTLGIHDPIFLGYRDSGMAGTQANGHPDCLAQAQAKEVVERVVREIRRLRPHVVLTFEPEGLYGHPDHVAISRHATAAFHLAGDGSAFPEHLREGLEPFAPLRLYYRAMPKGWRYRMQQRLWEMKMVEEPPREEMKEWGTLVDEITCVLDVSPHLDAKLAAILCHGTQVRRDWPYLRLAREVTQEMMGTEHFIRFHPPLQPGATDADFFEGLV